MSSVICAPVPLEHLAAVWPDARHHAERATKTAGRRMDTNDLYASLLSGRHLLWVVYDAATKEIIATFTTRIEAYPKLRALVIEWVGGTRMKDWLSIAHECVVRHAKENNCAQLEASGRNAWIRWVSREGWKPEFVQYVMEV